MAVPFSARLAVRACAMALVLGPVAASAAGPAGNRGPASTYTRHDFSRCAVRPSPHPDVVEVRACAGLDGIAVVWTGEPDASSLGFGTAEAVDAPIPGLDTFHEVRGLVEWRGPRLGGRIRPIAAIVRYDTGPSIGRLGASRLVLYRLTPRRASCVMGVVKATAPGANAAAREIVDRRAVRFVCGRDKAVSPS
ncbi:hypothetical protein [Methylobacterium trifolii]|uniref:hypothetical protein n=1 Tax=Methylobacterium trifolii TaxID=1003092 RepID=UPI001EDE8F74|nr:hypothetical protein [Methylobacterium trifolii]